MAGVVMRTVEDVIHVQNSEYQRVKTQDPIVFARAKHSMVVVNYQSAPHLVYTLSNQR